jgi:hypothetical protein
LEKKQQKWFNIYICSNKHWGNFWIICNSFCKCLHFRLFCKVGFWFFGLSYIFLVFLFHLKVAFACEDYKWFNLLKWKYMWNVHEWKKEYEISPNLQTKSNQNPKSEEKIILKDCMPKKH